MSPGGSRGGGGLIAMGSTAKLTPLEYFTCTHPPSHSPTHAHTYTHTHTLTLVCVSAVRRSIFPWAAVSDSSLLVSSPSRVWYCSLSVSSCSVTWAVRELAASSLVSWSRAFSWEVRYEASSLSWRERWWGRGGGGESESVTCTLLYVYQTLDFSTDTIILFVI